MDPRPPAGAPRLPGYTVERRLGGRGDSPVWAARTRSGEPVALKVLTVDSSAADRARRQLAVLAGVDHPHVMRVVELVESQGALVAVLPLAEGGTLEQLVRERGVLEPGEVVTACAPVAQALATVHQRGVVHGDVTAASVLLTAEGLPLLADVGFAGLSARRPGAPGFTAPEVLAGEPATAAADVFGLAAAAVLGLTGRAPERYAVLPGIAPATSGAIGRCLEADPHRRPSASVLAAALFAMAEPEAISLAASADAGATSGRRARARAADEGPGPGSHRARHGRGATVEAPLPTGGGGRRRRRTATTAAASAAAGLAGGGAAASGATATEGSASTASPPAAPPRPGSTAGSGPDARAGSTGPHPAARSGADAAVPSAAHPPSRSTADVGSLPRRDVRPDRPSGPAVEGARDTGTGVGTTPDRGPAVDAGAGPRLERRRPPEEARHETSAAPSGRPVVDPAAPSTARPGPPAGPDPWSGPGAATPPRPVDTGSRPVVDAGPQRSVDTGSRPYVHPGRQPAVDTGSQPRVDAGSHPVMDTASQPRVDADSDPVVDTGPTLAAPFPDVDHRPADPRSGEEAPASVRRQRRTGQRTEDTDRSAVEAPPAARRNRRGDDGAGTGTRRRRLNKVDIAWIAVAATLLVTLVGAGLVVGRFMGGSGDEAAPPLPPASPQPTSTDAAAAATEVCGAPEPAPDEAPPAVEDWTPVLADLYAQRSRAFETLDPALLCDVYVPTSTGLAGDIELIREYAEAGVRPAEIEFTIVSAELVEQAGARATLLVTDELPPYELVNESREVVREQQGLPRESWEAEMLPSADGDTWRFG